MKLLMYGVNKETVMKEDASKYFLDDNKKKKHMLDIVDFDGVEEIAILTNDFRNEYYLYVDESIFSHGEFLRYLADATQKSLQEIILETYSKFNEDVLRHIFEIASGYLSEPKGSFDELESVEEALNFAKTMHTSGEVIYRMFKNAIYLAYDLKLEDETKPINRSVISGYIYSLKEHMNGLDKKNYLISGNDLEVYFLTKLLLFAGARSVSIIQKDEAGTLDQYKKIKASLSEIGQSKLYPITEKSMYYRLSKVDAAILDTNEINLLDKEILEEVSIIRQTKKIQYLIDTGGNSSLDMEDFPELDLDYIPFESDASFNDDELANAIAVFDEKLGHQINQFMNFLERLQSNNVEEHLLK